MSKWFIVKLSIMTVLSIVPVSLSALDCPFPSTWKGIHIVPMAELNLPINVKKAIIANQQQMDTKGYIDSNDNDAKFLLSRKGKKDGWVGAKRIFKYPRIGQCAYSQTDIISIELSKETTKYLINNKPTSILVEGNVKDGFLYEVSWYAGTVMRTLECAHKRFDRRIVGEMVGLSNRIEGEAG